MIQTRTTLMTIFIAASLLLAACGGLPGAGSAEQPTALPPSVANTNIIVEGKLEPRESVDLAFSASGKVAEVLVEEGDLVKVGDVIARLGEREQFESNVAGANLDLLSAQQELLNAKEALLKLEEDLPDAQTAALQALTDAKEEVRDAEREYKNFLAPSDKLDIDSAKATLVLAEDKWDDAKEDYEPYANKPETSLVRAAFLSRLVEAEKAYEAAVRQYNRLAGLTGSDFDITQAASRLEIANTRLARAQEKFDILSKGLDPRDVTLAESRISTADGRVAAADASLKTAQKALENLELLATIDGAVVDENLTVGQQVGAGAPVVTLADFSQWYVDTDDLTEIEVVDIEAGQEALVSFDAIPDLQFAAVVERIKSRSEEKRGDITYTTRLLLKEADPRLRWGMTSVVEFPR